jgi:ABC-type branched-subunit amino acid transport system permease subunit
MRQLPALVRTVGITAVVAVVVSVVVLNLSTYWLRVASTSLNFACVALAWGFLIGFAGQLNFAPAAIWGAGAYVAAVLAAKFGWNPWLAFAAATIAGALFGALLTIPAVRLHRIYLGLFTLAFGELFRLFTINEQWLTNGPSGFGLSRVPFTGPLASATGIALTTGAVLILVYLGLVVLMRSSCGLYIRAVRDDQQAADARGVNVTLWKLWSFVISSGVMAAAGALFAFQTRFVSPEMLYVDYSFQFIVMGLFGGTSTLVGPIIGAVSINVLLEVLRSWEAMRLVLLGVIVCVSVLALPQGIAGTLARFIHYRSTDRLLTARFREKGQDL